MRLIDFFDRSADRYPQRAFLIDETGTRTYAETRAHTHRIANGLIAAGCTPGTKVAVFSPNLAVAFECILGLLRAGAAWVPLNAKNGVEENVHIIRTFEVEYLFYHSSFSAQVDAYVAASPGIRRLIRMDGTGDGTLAALTDGVTDIAPGDLGVGLDTLTAVFPTGGTTGLSKGAVWSNQTWATMIANLHCALPVRKAPVHLVVAPMTHAAGGVALMLMASGATQVILPGFDAKAVMEAIERHKVTHLFLPPTAIYMLLAHPDLRKHDYSSLDYFIYAAAPMSVDKLKEAVQAFGPVMAQTFGQAEAPMLCTCLTPADHDVLGDPVLEKRLASCGRSTLLTEVAIMADDGRRLPAGEVGEIVVRGPLVMKGYYKNPEATAAASEHGWHHTSDIGYADEDGYVYIVDRKRDMIISGGFNVFPSEIEQVIWSHPAVQDCAVVGAPDDKWGEAVTACVELKPGLAVEPAELIALCRDKLGPVKAPKTVEIWETLPRSAVGKVLKRKIREHFWAGRTRLV